jgi:DNA-directed RNA polymerase specialized sigma24 family protein
MQEVATLVAGRGMSYREVSQELGISESAVKRYAEQVGKRMSLSPRRAMFDWYRSAAGDRDAA